jgi:hypothetical protein
MNSRDRVLATINHHLPDRVPLDLGSTAATGINIHAYLRLKKALGLSTEGVRIFDIFGVMADVEQDVIDALGVDIMLVPSLAPRFGININRWKDWTMPDDTKVKVPEGFQTIEDKGGGLLLIVDGRVVGRMPKGGYYFSEMANASMGGLDSLADPPDPDKESFDLLIDEDLRFRQEVAHQLRLHTDKALVIDLIDNIRWNTSIANWLYAMAADPQRTSELHKKKSINLLNKVKQLADALGDSVDIFAIYQDYGTQKGELISPTTFAHLVKPNYKRIFDWIHTNTNWKIMFHSCGSIYHLIPHLIEMGVDILNPIQANTANMDPSRLKAEFGDYLVFWGGGVDTQTILPFGSPENVCQQVKERISIFAPGGGFVFAPTQDIQADVPVENLLTMYAAVREYGKYGACT